MTDEALAKAVRDHYKADNEAEVGDVATALGETPGRIHFIVDEFKVGDDGKVEHVGPGGGGGWVPALSQE